MESYSSASEYLAALEARSRLPAGFRTSTASIRFFPAERSLEASLPMNLSLILMERETPDFAAVFTRNLFPGAPVLIGRRRLVEPLVRGVLINNKISNVCAPNGTEDAEGLLSALGQAAGTPARMLFAASTGIIGWRLPVKEMEEALPGLVGGLSGGSILPVARAIMTTDRYPKVRRAGVGKGSIVGIAKGAGMIEPNMGTLLCFLLTDVAVPRERMRGDLSWCVERTLNRISVDGDQSTSDTALLFSSGLAGGADEAEFRGALLEVLAGLAADIVRNGEGTAHVVRVRVEGARGEDEAAAIGKAVINSPLVKTAMYGNDPNVGRIVSAVGDFCGNRGIPLDAGALAVGIGGVEVFSGGSFRLDASKEAALSAYLKNTGFDPQIKGYPQHDRCVEIRIRLKGAPPAREGRVAGSAGADAAGASAEVLGTDLSHEYIRENADYRS